MMTEDKREKILEVKDLTVSFKTGNGKVQAVRDISFDLYRGETLAIVGESGSGKSVTSKAILGISAVNAVHESGEILYRGKDLLQISEQDFHELRGSQISMVFQDPLSALNPIMRTGKQITEAILLNHKTEKAAAKKTLDGLRAGLARYLSGQPQSGRTPAEILDQFKQIQNHQIQLETKFHRAEGHAREAVRYAKTMRDEISKHIEKDLLDHLKKMNHQIEAAQNDALVGPDLLKRFQEARSSYLSDRHASRLAERLQTILADLEALIEKDDPDFFQLAYQQLKGGNEADFKSFQQDFVHVLSETIREADLSMKAERQKVRELIAAKQAIFEARPLDRKACTQAIKEIAKAVTAALNPVDTMKDSTLYTFENTAMNMLRRYVEGIGRNRKEERRYARQKAKFDQIVQRGKNPGWKVVPLDVLDLEWAQDRLTGFVARLGQHLDQLDQEQAKTDYQEKAQRFVRRLSRFASKAGREVTNEMAKDRAINLMREVGIPQPELRFKQFPFELSGGMRQRIVIAIALSSDPDILICDEPTTALDVTIQAQILELINQIKRDRNLSIIFITHDLGVVANMADRIAVMYAGKIVEKGCVDEVFYEPAHPYTWALLSSMPDLETKEKLSAIPGTPPNMLMPPVGDAFAARNHYAMKIDFERQPPLFKLSETHYAATWLLAPGAPKVELPPIVRERIERMKKREAAHA